MPPIDSLIVLTAGGLASLGLVTGAAMWAFARWLGLKHAALAADRGTPHSNPAGQRIELADLKERVRKLEAIAAGVDI